MKRQIVWLVLVGLLSACIPARQTPEPTGTPTQTGELNPYLTRIATVKVSPGRTDSPSPLPAPSATPRTYTVKKGDTVSGYYVDSANGSDANPGTSIDKPWRSLTPVNDFTFLPGDTVSFKRGSSWDSGLTIKDSGLPGSPIIFTSYGTGNLPVFRNPGNANYFTTAIIINASWVILENIMIRDAYYVGVYISEGANHNIILDVEVTNVGIGIQVSGQYNLVTGNYVHDLHMVVNTPGGNDDYGAIGINFYGSNNEASYNRILNCRAPSYDYGTDGGAFEWFDHADNNYIHHNWAENNNGFLEVGGGSAINTMVAYNVSLNNDGFSVFHLDDKFASVVQNFRLVNNTIIETKDNGWAVIGFVGEPTMNTIIVINNIFFINGFQMISNKTDFSHNHNLYYLGEGTQLRLNLNETELIANPSFFNLDGKDFHLQSYSPAIDAGVNFGFNSDFDNLPVPFGKSTDIGAFEFQGSP